MLSAGRPHVRLLALRASRPVQSASSVRLASTNAYASSTGSSVKTAVYGTLLLAGAGLFGVYYFDARAGLHRYVITPAIRRLFDAETGHKLAVRVLASGLAPRDPIPDDEVLRTELWGEVMPNPVGLAAGFDKDGEAIDGLFGLGFGWVEIGSVTPNPQPGNPKPRVFHLPEDSALINRYGFPSQGHAALLRRLEARYTPTSASPARPLLAVNLGKNKTSAATDDGDYVSGVQRFAPHADVLVINVSSPNTPGLRGLQDPQALDRLLAACTSELKSVQAPRRPRLLLKLAPDLDEEALAHIALVAVGRGVDGVIVSNTTIARPKDLVHPNKAETGGLSGPPVKPLALAAVRTLRAHLPASVPIIGCGGVSSGADALEFARAGASAVQMYTAFGYDGPGAARRVKDELSELLKKDGKTWSQVVRERVEKTALKQPAVVGQLLGTAVVKEPKEPQTEIYKLIAEAKELESKLDALAKVM